MFYLYSFAALSSVRAKKYQDILLTRQAGAPKLPVEVAAVGLVQGLEVDLVAVPAQGLEADLDLEVVPGRALAAVVQRRPCQHPVQCLSVQKTHLSIK
ncbi:hypothetical protein BEL04_04070 [Mucilaginibacter sp. PPCGB 2223]|nr:hypothetical protein BEL04_04070 [Mucilaginibacter sp. PPCGB 2223]